MTVRRLGVAAALVDGAWVEGDVAVDGATIAALGVEPRTTANGPRRVAVAGFVDLQVNGFAGVDITSADLDGYRHASIELARTGVTSFLATIPTAAPERYRPALTVTAAAMAEPLGGATVAGVHLEGPLLAPGRAGAHRPDWLRTPTGPGVAADLDAWLATGTVALVTLAPELPGAIELIGRLVAAGVVVSVGHTDADAATAHAAFDAGASAITHLWNAQRPMAARDPGVMATALTRPDVAVCVIADLVHVHAETLLLSVAAAGDRLVVVTDAVSLAGMPDGPYRFAGRQVTLADGAVRLDDGTLAGSAAPLDAGVRNLVGLGVGLETAIAAVTSGPARALRRPDLGRLAVGGRADVVVLDDEVAVVDALVGGTSAF